MTRYACTHPVEEITAADLAPGDVICGSCSNPDLLVITVEPSAPLDDGTAMVRFRGRLDGHARRMTWNHRSDQAEFVHIPRLKDTPLPAAGVTAGDELG